MNLDVFVMEKRFMNEDKYGNAAVGGTSGRQRPRGGFIGPRGGFTDLQQNFAVIAGCYSLLLRGCDGRESRISAAKSCLWLFFP
jgi:hypothetical protein